LCGRLLPAFPTRRSSDLDVVAGAWVLNDEGRLYVGTRPETVAARSPAFPASLQAVLADADPSSGPTVLITDRDTLLSVQPLENRSEEHTSELQSRENLVC